jgi:hypothetical protein
MHIPERSALLAIDIGNTNITLGLWYSGDWRHNWRARTVHDKMPDEYAVLVRSFLRDAGLDYSVIGDVVMASVVPPLTHAFAELTRKNIGLEPLIVNARSKLGIQLEVDNPEQVGADRIVNAAAVHQLYGGPAIVIDFGTATTFDVISQHCARHRDCARCASAARCAALQGRVIAAALANRTQHHARSPERLISGLPVHGGGHGSAPESSHARRRLRQSDRHRRLGELVSAAHKCN